MFLIGFGGIGFMMSSFTPQPRCRYGLSSTNTLRLTTAAIVPPFSLVAGSAGTARLNM